MRLQKYLAQAGVASRRGAERIIKDGRVTLNGRVVSSMALDIDPESDYIKVDGRLIKTIQPKVYIILYKPRGYITSTKDEKERPTVFQLIKGIKYKLFPVGRLDYDTEGLLLLTNDGNIANVITHPKYQIPKKYLVKVNGIPSENKIKALEKGVKLEDGTTSPAKVKIYKTTRNDNAWLQITVTEGKNQLIKRMFNKIRHPVRRLIRTNIAFLSLKGLKPGQYRFLTQEEIKRLKGKEVKK